MFIGAMIGLGLELLGLDWVRIGLQSTISLFGYII